MTTKEYLCGYKRMIKRIRILEQSIDKLISEIGGGSIGIRDGMPTGTTLSDQTGRIAVRLAELKEKREAMRLAAVEIRDEIEDVILAVEDPIYMQLLYDRYVRLMSWNDITEDLRLDNDQYVRGKLHSKALDAVEGKLNDKNIIYLR